MEDGYLLISDLDGTLLGDTEALRRFAEWYDGRRDRLHLVYNSGRFVPSILESVATTDLPIPHAVIGGVGTEIQCILSEQQVGIWPPPDKNWKPALVCSLLASYDELELQPSEFLSDHKISYYVDGASDELMADIRDNLTAASCHVNMIYSSDRDLDILPSGVHKGSAAAYVAAHWSFASDQVLVAGDTANDLTMFQQGFRGIVVENAHSELKRLDCPSVFHAQHQCAGGVLEGLENWLAYSELGAHRLLGQR